MYGYHFHSVHYVHCELNYIFYLHQQTYNFICFVF